MNDDKELQIQFPKGKKTLFKNRIFVQETIHLKKKIVSFKDLLCRDTHTHTHTHIHKSRTNSKQHCPILEKSNVQS